MNFPQRVPIPKRTSGYLRDDVLGGADLLNRFSRFNESKSKVKIEYIVFCDLRWFYV
jgi:hypothetical protein